RSKVSEECVIIKLCMAPISSSASEDGRRTNPAPPLHDVQAEDHRILPIADKVFAHERLSFDDTVAIYRSSDILAMGWLANHVRERMHGDVTYFNVNRH